MSVLRQLNLLGQQRVDVPHIRMLESSIAADFDVLGGRIIAGSRPLVIRGFTLTNYTAGTPAVSVQLSVADSILMNMGASEAGTFLWVPSNRSAETLDSSINPRVSGGFTANQTNYIGLDLSRKADSTTSDLVQFLDANTLIEQPKTVPLARTLDYRIVISTVPFSAQPNIVPIAKIKTNSSNQVAALATDVEDARNLAFRLGAGSDFPNRNYSFGWSDGRVEFNTVTGTTINQFRGGDKIIQSQKDWMDAVMTRIWEIGGGENWYSPVADRNIRMARAPSPAVFASTGDNFEFVSSHLHWQGLSIMFENSNGSSVYRNTIADQLGNQTGLTDITPGQCIYVDLDRTVTTSLTAQKANLWQLGTPAIPGSRVVIAWCVTTGVIMTRDSQFPVNTALQPATTTVVGGVRLAYAAGTPSTPTVPPLDANNAVTIGAGAYTIVGNNNALNITGGGAGAGLVATGGTTGAGATISAGSAGSGTGLTVNSFNGGAGVVITAGSGGGITSTSTGTSSGLVVSGGGNALLAAGIINAGILSKGGSTTSPSNFSTRANGAGVYAEAGGSGNGVVARGGFGTTIGTTTSNRINVGVYGVGSGGGEGVVGLSAAANNAVGVVGEGSDGFNTIGVSGTGKNTGSGGVFQGGTTGGHGIQATGGGSGDGGIFTGVMGVRATGIGIWHGITAKGGSGGVGAGPTGGGFGIYAEGGDFNGFSTGNDALRIPGNNAGGVFSGSPTQGGIGVAGYGQGVPGSQTGGLGGYFVGGTDPSFGGSHGILVKGGQGQSGLFPSGIGIQSFGGFGAGTANGGAGGTFFGGGSSAATGGTGISGTGGSPNGGGGVFTGNGSGAGVTASSGSGVGITTTSTSGFALQATGNTTATTAVRVTAGSGKQGIDIVGGGGSSSAGAALSVSNTGTSANTIFVSGGGATSTGVAITGVQTGISIGSHTGTGISIFQGTNSAPGVDINSSAPSQPGISVQMTIGVAGSAGLFQTLNGAPAVSLAHNGVSPPRGTLNLASQVTPSAPANGDIWFDGTNIKIRVGGVTKTFTLV